MGQVANQVGPVTKDVETICGFCGVGCGLTIHVQDDKIHKVSGTKNNPSSHGEACMKGQLGWRYLYSDKRLTEPLIRKNGELIPASWEEALDVVASRLGKTKNQYGPDSIGLFSSSRSTNELNY